MTLVEVDNKKERVEHVDVALDRTLYLAITSLAIAKKTTKSNLIASIVSESPEIRKEIKEIEGEPESIFAVSGDAIEKES